MIFHLVALYLCTLISYAGGVDQIKVHVHGNELALEIGNGTLTYHGQDQTLSSQMDASDTNWARGQFATLMEEKSQDIGKCPKTYISLKSERGDARVVCYFSKTPFSEKAISLIGLLRMRFGL